MNTILLTLALLPSAGPPADPTFARDVKPFLERHCYSCHDAKKAKAGFRIDELGTDFLAGKTADVWKEVIDQINSGAMPPKGEPRPDPKASFALVEWVGRELKRAEREARVAGGRNLLRRLNRDEYANTVGDLFGLDLKFVEKVREELPADGQADGFDRVAAALFFDQTQLEKYMAVADLIAREAVQTAPPKANSYTWQTEAGRRDPPEKIQLQSGGLPVEGKMIPAGPGVYRMRPGGFETWGSPGLDREGTRFIHLPSGPFPKLDGVVTTDGYYRVRIRGGGFPGERDEPIRVKLTYAIGTPLESEHIVDVKGTLEKPDVAEVVVFLRAGRDGQTTGFKVEWNGLTDVRLRNPDLAPLQLKYLQLTGMRQKALANRDEKKAAELRAELDEVLAKLKDFTGPEYVPNPKVDLAKVPRLFLDSIEVHGPVAKNWPPKSHTILGLDDSLPQTPAGLRTLFERLLPRAYRRPVTKDEIDRVAGLAVRAMTEKKATFHEAAWLGLQYVLVSPGFVYLSEPEPKGTPRPLTDYELASRLSYFIWASMPDEELVRLAATGKLRDPKVLDAQVTRMLADPRSRRFVEGFAGQWLDVRLYGTVMPAKEYRSYDRALELASKEEPLEFFAHVLKENLAVTTFLDSDFVVINERLAKHYGIEGVRGETFRRVAIRSEHHRGGVLGMAGLLTLLSDGNRTLPVRRAAWVREKLLNDPPPPPPPNAGDIQPNTAGKNLSVRQRLALHRNEPTCASCHAKLDPYGLALENYDAIGAWREKQNGEGIRPAQAPTIDPSGELKSGRKFADLAGYKSALIAEKDIFARAFTEKLLTYALCRPVAYVDRTSVDELVEALRRDQYRLQALIRAIVASEPFRTK